MLSFLSCFLILTIQRVATDNVCGESLLNITSEQFLLGKHPELVTLGILWPDDPKDVEDNTQLIMTNAKYESFFYKLKEFSQIAKNLKFRKECPTVIYIYGWRDTGEKDYSILAIRSAYIARQHNIIAFDWSYYAKNIFYPRVVHQLGIIGQSIAVKLMKFLDADPNYKIEKLHVGHGLGAQCAGLVGRHLKKIFSGRYVIPRIFALDPAGPGFEFSKWLVPLGGFDSISKTDAKYVQVIHTNGGTLGSRDSAGHADFYPNGGEKQYGCELDIIEMTCNHARAWYLFQESVRNQKSFPAIKCNSLDDFNKEKCAGRWGADETYLGIDADLSLGKAGLRDTKLILLDKNNVYREVEPFFLAANETLRSQFFNGIILSTF